MAYHLHYYLEEERSKRGGTREKGLMRQQESDPAVLRINCCSARRNYWLPLFQSQIKIATLGVVPSIMLTDRDKWSIYLASSGDR
jgi:hypothetical protein